MLFIYEQWHLEVSTRFVTRLVDESSEMTQVDGFPMDNHTDLQGRTGQRKRTTITDHLMSRLQPDRVARGQCPLCGYDIPRQEEPRLVISLKCLRPEAPEE